MSDFSIPGVTSKYNTDETIKALVDAERITLRRMEKERDLSKQQKSVWLRLNNQLNQVRENARSLFGFENPFDEKIAASSDEGVLTATATRLAIEDKKSIQVKQIATSDRFLSRSLDKDFRAPKGTYRFTVGEEEVKINFAGGSLKELVRAINKKGGELLKASAIPNTKNSQIILIEAGPTGSGNQLNFHDQALVFGELAGIIQQSPQASREPAIDKYSVKAWTEDKTLDKKSFSITEGTITLHRGAEVSIPVSPALHYNENMVLSLEIRTELIPEEPKEEIEAPTGPELPGVGGIEFQDIRVESAQSHTVLPEWQPPQQAERIDDMQVLYVAGGGESRAVAPITDSEEFYTITVKAEALPEVLDALRLRNRNTHRIIHIRNIRIYDKTSRGDYRPVNPLSTAEDSTLIMDGIEIVRDSNTIDDLLPGVNLTLHSASEATVKLSVEKDVETIKDILIRFIGSYNKLLTQLDILTRRDGAIVESAQFLDETERDRAREELALFLGNISLMQLKTRLQGIMMNPYPTAGGRQLTLLAQMGISTSAGTLTSGIDKSRLRGYLQIDESNLDETLARHGEWVKQLFGYDTDLDLIIDSGVAYSMERNLKSYVQSGGIIASRIGNLDGTISRQERQIEKYNDHLVDYERELKLKYGIMEGALNALEQSSQTIDNLNRRTNQ